MTLRSDWLAPLLLFALSGCSKPKPVEITPRSAQVAAIRPGGVQLSLVLDAHNPNSFPIVASNVSGVLELQDGTELGRGSSETAFTIPANGDQALNARLDVSWSSVSLLAPYALAAKPVPYRIRGSARLGSEHLNLDVPFTVAGQLTPEQVIQAGLRGTGALLQQH